MSLQIEIVNSSRVELSDTLLQDIARLRQHAWAHAEDSSTNSIASWISKSDKKTVHFLGYHQGELVGASGLRVFSEWDPIEWAWFDSIKIIPQLPFAYFSRLVVLPSFRLRGYGRLLTTERIKFASQIGVGSVLCDVPTYRKKQLISMGFSEIQPAKPGSRFNAIEWIGMYRKIDGVTPS